MAIFFSVEACRISVSLLSMAASDYRLGTYLGWDVGGLVMCLQD